MNHRATHPAVNLTLCSLFAAVLAACGGGTSDSGTSVDAASLAATDASTAGVSADTDAEALKASRDGLTSSTATLAKEGGSFKVSGTQTVRYGADSRWVQKLVTGSGQCTVAFFGSDPAWGTRKTCELVVTAAPTPVPAPVAPAPIAAPAPAPAPIASPAPAATPAPAPVAAAVAPTPVAAPAPAPVAAPAPPPVAAPTPAPAPAAAGTVTAWVRQSMEGETFTSTTARNVRYGDGVNWVVKTAITSGTCSVSYFGSDPAYGATKFCEVQMTVPAVAQIAGAMPVVNTALIPRAASSYATARVRTLTTADLAWGVNIPTPTTIGAFREPCNFSHMAFNDPIVYPGQPGASHLHTFFGNAGADASSTGDSLASTGNGTCAGGTLNRTGYWIPTLIDVRTGQPLVPTSTNFYYKLGYGGVRAGTVQPFPKGLRMIAGDSKNTSPIATMNVGLECVSGGGHQPSIPSCAIGDELNVAIIFPQCWDGVNLDSPDHKSHMAYATGAGCPSTHPVALPEIALNTHYKISEANSGAFLKLSSDNYAGPGGYSMHADWFGGWDVTTNKAFLAGCINGNMDCHDYLLGDGRILY